MISEQKRQKIAELAKIIHYPTSEHRYLIDAMNAERRYQDNKGKSNKEIMNGVMATVGDAVLREVLITKIYDGKMDMEQLSNIISKLEDNKTQKRVCDKLGIEKFAYKGEIFFDDLPEHNKPKTGEKHYPYLESIIAAMYYDAGQEKTREWIIDWLFPQLEKECKDPV